ncbi:hypothetical protein [Gymnodinialimonas hymeniacidonis]|uniref:hypothetical protein n=1 Tax=Gymnodinialimonas hymeniacidonis TaxID=3126508 RepID=UPI0034C628B9
MATTTAIAESPASQLVTGEFWSATLNRGQQVRLKFNADGTIDVRALFAPRLTWTATDDGLCLTGGPGGTMCATLFPTETGFIGLDGETLILRLDR